MARKHHGLTGSAQESAIDETAVALASEQQVSSELGEETVILHVEDGVYYGLDAVGTSIWRLLQVPRPVSEIRDRLVEEYDVDRDRCQRDLLALLRDLKQRRLIDVSEPGGTAR